MKTIFDHHVKPFCGVHENEYTGVGTALLCIAAAIFISSLDKSANTDVSQHDFSDFLVLPLFPPFQRGRGRMVTPPLRTAGLSTHITNTEPETWRVVQRPTV